MTWIACQRFLLLAVVTPRRFRSSAAAAVDGPHRLSTAAVASLRLGQGKEPAQDAAQLGLGLVKLPHGRRVAGLGGDFLLGRHRAVAGLDDGVERLPLVGHVALDGFDQVRNQLVAAFELHVDLAKHRASMPPNDAFVPNDTVRESIIQNCGPVLLDFERVESPPYFPQVSDHSRVGPGR